MSDILNCYECGAEFTVQPSFDIDEPISFCPYCGSEIEHEEEEDDLDDLEDEDYRH
jgi:rRNA maturation endonuclease Nob1